MLTEFDAGGLTVAPPHLPVAFLNGADEARLVALARHGCAAAIEQLVGRYETRVFRLARNITGNHEDSEEVVQDAFFKAFLRLAAFRGDSRFYTWLVRIAVNEALMKIRGRRLKEVSIDETNDSEEGEGHTVTLLQDWRPNPEQRHSQEELRRILETAISKLTPGYRIVFHLRDVEGFSSKETAQILRLSLTTVKSRARRARLQLRNSLDAYFRRQSASKNHRGAAGVMSGVRPANENCLTHRCISAPKLGAGGFECRRP